MALTETLRQNAVNQLDENERVPAVSPINLSTPTFGPSNQISASALSSTPSLKEAPAAPLTDFGAFVQSLAPDTTALSERGKELRGEITDTMGTLGTQGARLEEVEGELGLPEDRKRLRELNLQIAQLTGDFNEAIVNEEGVARPIEFITGRQDFLQKKSAVMVGALTSVAQALQGNITLAEQTADRTVQREFADEEAELERLSFEYTENKDDLEKADKKGADQLALYLDERKRVLADQKEERKGALALAQAAAVNGAPNSVVSRIAQASTQEEALSIAGSWLYTPPSGGSGTGQSYTQGELTAQGFADRVSEASAIIDEVGNQFTGAFSGIASWLPNKLKSDDRQRFEQAQRNFINAVLRRESGAAIGESEFKSAALQYFPQSGDSAAVLEQKRRNRQTVLQSLQREGGAIQDPTAVGLNPRDPLNLGI